MTTIRHAAAALLLAVAVATGIACAVGYATTVAYVLALALTAISLAVSPGTGDPEGSACDDC